MALRWHALTLRYLGYIDQGRVRLNEASSLTRALGEPFTEAFVLVFACWVARAIGSHEDQHQYADRLIALSDEHGFPYLWGTRQRKLRESLANHWFHGIAILDAKALLDQLA